MNATAQQPDARRMLIALGLAALVVVVSLLASGPAASARGGGGGTDTECGATVDDPALQGNIPALRKQLFCLINEQRRKHARNAVKVNKDLSKAARFHIAEMVEKDCLAHTCGKEPGLEERIDRSGYFDGATNWSFAENTGCAQSNGAMIANWMASQFHRLNILGKSYEDIGIAISKKRVPSRCKDGYVTFVLVFGFTKS